MINLRSRAWFDNPANLDMTALYLERTMNYGLDAATSFSREGRLSASRSQGRTSRLAIDITSLSRAESATASAKPAASRSSFPSIRSRRRASVRPQPWTATSQYLSLVEILYGYPIDGVVLTTGCDKTTPAQN